MPALPVISDPDAFRALFEASFGATAVDPKDGIRSKAQAGNNNNNNGRSRDGQVKLDTQKVVKPHLSERFKDLAFAGDHKLLVVCTRVVTSIWGNYGNRKLVKRILDDWLSNDNWLSLAIVYRLDRFVGPEFIREAIKVNEIIFQVGKSQVGNKQKGKEGYASLKALADLWEAYFAGLIEERELWLEDMDDIERFFRRLLIMKYQKLIPLAVDYDIENTFSTNEGISMATKCTTKMVLRSDELLENVFGKTPLDGGGTNDYGRLVSCPEHGKPNHVSSGIPERTRFATDEDEATSELLYGFREGWKRNLSVVRL